MIEYLQMGGYAAYVWPSYAIALAALILNVVWARRTLRRARQDARRRLASQTEMTTQAEPT